jgi:hypothetical protein
MREAIYWASYMLLLGLAGNLIVKISTDRKLGTSACRK